MAPLISGVHHRVWGLPPQLALHSILGNGSAEHGPFTFHIPHHLFNVVKALWAKAWQVPLAWLQDMATVTIWVGYTNPYSQVIYYYNCFPEVYVHLQFNL